MEHWHTAPEDWEQHVLTKPRTQSKCGGLTCPMAELCCKRFWEKKLVRGFHSDMHGYSSHSGHWFLKEVCDSWSLPYLLSLAAEIERDEMTLFVHLYASVLKFSFVLYLPDTRANLVMTTRIPRMLRKSEKHEKIWDIIIWRLLLTTENLNTTVWPLRREWCSLHLWKSWYVNWFIDVYISAFLGERGLVTE